jgi:hypothetical protein
MASSGVAMIDAATDRLARRCFLNRKAEVASDGDPDGSSRHASTKLIMASIGACTAQTLSNRVRQAERDQGRRPARALTSATCSTRSLTQPTRLRGIRDVQFLLDDQNRPTSKNSARGFIGAFPGAKSVRLSLEHRADR